MRRELPAAKASALPGATLPAPGSVPKAAPSLRVNESKQPQTPNTWQCQGAAPSRGNLQGSSAQPFRFPLQGSLQRTQPAWDFRPWWQWTQVEERSFQQKQTKPVIMKTPVAFMIVRGSSSFGVTQVLLGVNTNYLTILCPSFFSSFVK